MVFVRSSINMNVMTYTSLLLFILVRGVWSKRLLRVILCNEICRFNNCLARLPNYGCSIAPRVQHGFFIHLLLHSLDRRFLIHRIPWDLCLLVEIWFLGYCGNSYFRLGVALQRNCAPQRVIFTAFVASQVLGDLWVLTLNTVAFVPTTLNIFYSFPICQIRNLIKNVF